MITNLKLYVQDKISGKMFDLSETILSVSWETTILEQPGKLTFKYLDNGNTYFTEGSQVAVTFNDIGLFIGYVFKRSRSNEASAEVTAYDQMRYLQNKDVANMEVMTSEEIFLKICKEQQLKYRVVHGSAYKCASRLYDNKSYYEMIQTAIDETLIATGIWYMIRDNYGVLEHVNLSELLTPVIIGDNSLLTAFDFESSIDDDTYNQVKITKDNEETAKREVYIAKNSETIARWGLLQFYESADSETNEAQIIEKAELILALKNRPSRSLSLDCFGDWRIRAGNGVVLDIKALANEEVPQNQNALVYACTHEITANKHVMSLDLEIV